MATCVPIKDLRDTAKFTELVQNSKSPITVTKNGYDHFIVLTPEDYEELCNAEGRARQLERLMLMERERRSGITFDVHEAIAEVCERYDL